MRFFNRREFALAIPALTGMGREPVYAVSCAV
jgi:hypothetical protein